jgi:hypothetical protein
MNQLTNSLPNQFSPFPELGHHIQQSVMPLLVISGESLTAIGTGFVITSNGLMMTAAHVLEEAVKHGIPRKRQDGGLDYDLQLYAVYVTNRKNDDCDQYIGGPLPVVKFWHSPELDIAFCRLGSPYPESNWMPNLPVFRLSPSVPTVGERICGCGYHQMKGNIGHPTENGKIEVHYSQDTAYTPGRVIEVYPVRRDSVMLRFPCFRTDARFDAGMSGGPVVNQEGNVCGVICSSLPGDQSNPAHLSYASLIWPAFGTPIEIERAGQKPATTTLYDLAGEGRVEVDASFNSIQVTAHSNGSRTIGIRNR